MKDKALRIAHEMRNDVSGEIAATASVVGVYIDAVIRKAVRLPEEIRERALRMREEEIARFLRTVEICCQ